MPWQIEDIEIDKPNYPQGIYDLSGRKVCNFEEEMHSLENGIYIVNGQKKKSFADE